MKILELRSENVKRISVVEIRPDGSLVIIGGKNGAGKTSCLDSIEYALGGKGSIPSQPVKRGEEKAVITLKLGESEADLIVTRTIRPDGYSQLKVTAGDGASYPSPQSMLDKLIGALSFDPLEFSRMKPVEQQETVRNLVGLDFSDLNNQRETLYNERTLVNRQTNELKGLLANSPQYEDAPKEAINIQSLTSELETALASHKAIENAEYELERAKNNSEQANGHLVEVLNRISELEEQIANLKRQANKIRELVGTTERGIQEKGQHLADLQNKAIDPEPIRQKIAEAEGINRKVRANIGFGNIKLTYTALVEKAKELTNQIAAVDAEKAKRIKEAPFPIKGLSFDENSVLFNGLPFTQASSAEQLRVSMAMGIAMNPKLRIVLIRDGSLLDEDNLRMIAEMAEKAKAQVWLERVGEGKEVSVILEDGIVKEKTNVPA